MVFSPACASGGLRNQFGVVLPVRRHVEQMAEKVRLVEVPLDVRPVEELKFTKRSHNNNKKDNRNQEKLSKEELQELKKLEKPED